MKYKGAIFDMDGVLFDTERIFQQTWREIADECHVRLGDGFSKAVAGTNGVYMRSVIEKYFHVRDGSDIAEQCMKRVKEKLSVDVPVKKGVYEILHLLREKGLRIAVASSSSREQIETNLEKTGIKGYFDGIVSAAQVKHGKPAPDIFLYAAEKIGCEPEDCLVFEDSENGIKAGYSAGCMTVMVPDLLEPSPGILPYCSKICRDLVHAREDIFGKASGGG